LVVEATLTGTHRGDFGALPATGRAIGVEGVAVLRHSDGLVQQVDQVANAATLLVQLGELPPGAGRRDVPAPPSAAPRLISGPANPAGEAAARRFLAALGAPTAAGLVAELAADGVFFEVATLRPFTGAEGLATVHKILGDQLEGLTTDVTWLASAGPVVVAQVTHAGTWRGGEPPRQVELAAVYLFDSDAAGRLQRVARYANTLQWARAAGIEVPLRSRPAP
jgi:hypothetical protein